jgi:hypothetical protein
VNRTLVSIVIALAAMIAPMHLAFADEPPPTAEQLEAAKKAFAEGKTLHDQGRLPEAIEKFKESYRLSRNPVLLYNIAFTMDEANQKDLALTYYRKFLSDAPPAAPQRPTVSDRVKVLEKEKLEADLNGTGPSISHPPDTTKPDTTKPDTTKPDTTKPDTTKPDTTKPVKIKPAGTYGPTDFQHQIVEEAPPGKPLDISAFVPEDSGFTVTLFYRGKDDAKFTLKPMKWRYKELVGRIPASKVAGSSIQYYLEVKDQAGALVTRSGKSTSPNLVNVEANATPRFYPDITEEGDQHASASDIKKHDEEDPFAKGQQHTTPEPEEPVVVPAGPTVPGNGFADVGSKKYKYVKWGSTATAATMLGLSMTFYVLAMKQASALADDATNCPGGGTPPCRMFDDYDKGLQDSGQRDELISRVSLGLGVVAGAVAGYYWYKEHKAKKRGELKITSKTNSPETTWVMTPTMSDGYTGFAAAARF